MARTPELEVHAVSRRSFLARVGGLGIAVAFGGQPGHVLGADAVRLGGDLRPNVWVTIAADGTVTIVSPASEMGQGVMTTLPLLIAEEMDADWTRVRILQAPADAANYGNPGFRGAQQTGGSRTTPGYYEKLRLVGAQTRKVLVASAAGMLGVPTGELTTETQQGRACEIRPLARLWRHCQGRRHARPAAAGDGGRPQAGRAVALDRQPPHDASRRAVKGGRQRAVRHRRATAEHAVRRGAACARSRRSAGRDRRRCSEWRGWHHPDRPFAVWRRHRRRNRLGDQEGQGPAAGHLEQCLQGPRLYQWHAAGAIPRHRPRSWTSGRHHRPGRRRARRNRRCRPRHRGRLPERSRLPRAHRADERDGAGDRRHNGGLGADAVPDGHPAHGPRRSAGPRRTR